MSSQFKFKPDKIKYLSNIDTLDSSHKKIISGINKKRDEMPKKEKKLEKLRNELELLDSKNFSIQNYSSLRTKLIDEIQVLEEEIERVENYEDELEYYEKTHEILFNYYDIIDGHKVVSDNINNNSINNINNSSNITISEIKPESHNELYSDIKVEPEIKKTNTWDFDGIEIFKNTGELDKLDMLNAMSKSKRKEKKTTRKRVKNVETLVRDSNNIFDYLDGVSKDTPNITNNTTINVNINNFVVEPIKSTNNVNDLEKKYDRASLFEDYKILLEGYTTQKKVSKPCMSCGPTVNKVLIYSEGIYVCLVCGEVEKCIIENKVSNYKDPMVEKPTFPYKRKNHFCEWIKFICQLLVKVNIKSIC